ncbi:prolactin 2 isoform X1 [Polypterus senegalus]|uniref:prolactin 2 isoform X1 n=1 Tax=Polypterus senegalus TaxID=55291 RepID=UPI0019622F52|nr:prolactin 2 isoform X1 [Polypterus senegalus]
MRRAPVLLLALMCLNVEFKVFSAPLCVHGDSGCHFISVSDLFNRVIQYSRRMHNLSSDLYSEFEKYFLPSKNHIGSATQNCPTAKISTPNNKDNALRAAGEELMQVILQLLVAWIDPLLQFYQNIAHNKEFTNFSSSKVLEMSNMLHELKTGMEKLIQKMQVMGIISNSVNGLSPGESDLSSSASREVQPMNDYELLHCFRRDSNKIQNYLRILKCSIATEHAC